MPCKAGGTTMADLARRFMDEYAPSHLKPGTAALYRKIIEKRTFPGSANAGSQTSAGQMSPPCITNRTLGVLSRMLTLAEVWEVRPEGVNPCRFVKIFPEQRRERFLSDDDYRRLGARKVQSVIEKMVNVARTPRNPFRAPLRRRIPAKPRRVRVR